MVAHKKRPSQKYRYKPFEKELYYLLDILDNQIPYLATNGFNPKEISQLTDKDPEDIILLIKKIISLREREARKQDHTDKGHLQRINYFKMILNNFNKNMMGK